MMLRTDSRRSSRRYSGAWEQSILTTTSSLCVPGYHHESENKGNRKYFTVGAGFKMNVFQLDAGYVIATAKSNPLDQTLRFTLSFDMDGIQDLFKRR